MKDKCQFQLHGASFNLANALSALKICAFTIQTSNFLENVSFCRVMAEIALLDDKEPESQEGVDEPIRYVLLHLL